MLLGTGKNNLYEDLREFGAQKNNSILFYLAGQLWVPKNPCSCIDLNIFLLLLMSTHNVKPLLGEIDFK